MAENPQSPNHSTQQLLTIKEVAALYGLDITTIRRRIHSGELQAVKKPGAKSKNSQWFVIDPGWQQVSLSDHHKVGEFSVDDTHILLGSEVALLLGVIPRTVRKMAEDGRLGFVRTGKYGRSHRRYSITDVRKALVTIQKGSFQTKRPKRTETRAAVLKWAKERLAADLPQTETPSTQPEAPPQ